MILKRIADAIRKQNWFTVIIEILIVVIGIFLGMQVTEWNEDRKDQILAKEYLHRLHADMELSIAATERTKKFVADNTERTGFVLDSLKSCTLAEEDRNRFANGINHAGKLIPATFVRGTLDELLSSGRIGLIKSQAILDSLNEASREIEYQASVWSSLHARVRGLFYYIDEKAIIRVTDEERRNGFGTATWQELDADFEALCNDHKFHAAISLPERLGYVNVDWLNRNLANFRAARNTIAAEIRLPESEETPE